MDKSKYSRFNNFLNTIGFNTIDLYIGKTILLYVSLAALVLTLIATIIAFIDQTRNIGRGDVDFLFLIWYTILRMPGTFVLIFPISVLLGGVLGLGIMSKNSELVVMQSSGLSKLQIILSSCKLIIPIVILVSLLGQYIVPHLNKYSDNRFNYYSSEGRVSRTSWGIWVREGESFLSIRLVTSDNVLHGITRYDFEGTKLKQISNALNGTYNHGQWDMHNVTRTIFNDTNIKKEYQALEKWDLYITPERLEIFNLNSNELAVDELLDYISYLESNAIDSSRYRTSLYKKFMLPISMIIMLLLGASTVFGSLRSIPLSARVIFGLTIGFLFYLTNEILPNFTLVIGFPPIIGVMLPNIIFIIISFLILERKV